MQAHFTLSRAQFIAANYQLSSRPRRIATGIGASLLVGLAAMYAYRLPGGAAIAYFLVILLVGGVGLFLAGPQMVRTRFGRIYDKIESLGLPLRCTIESNCVKLESPNGVLRLDFEKLHRIVETKDFFFLFTSPTTAQLLPKEALDAGAQDVLRGAGK